MIDYHKLGDRVVVFGEKLRIVGFDNQGEYTIQVGSETGTWWIKEKYIQHG